jgi:uncharacterized protein
MNRAPTPLAFDRITERLRATLASPPRVDAVVAIARGGLVPGALVAHHLGLPLHALRSRYRDDAHVPQSSAPRLDAAAPDLRGLRVLLVDDVTVTGATLRAVAASLDAAAVTTLVFKGRPGSADWIVFDDVPECVIWPWHTAVAP